MANNNTKTTRPPPLPKYLKLISAIEDIPARIEYMVWATGEHNPAPEGIEDDLDTDAELIEKAFGITQDNYFEKENVGSYGGRPEQQLWEYLAYRFCGWTIVKCATPVMERRDGGKYSSFSWGHFTYGYFAGKSIEEALQKALDWAKKEHENVRIRPARKPRKKEDTADAEA